MKKEKTNYQKYFYDFGYQKFGPLLLSFTKWLLKEVEKQKLQKVFFISRDGYIMKQAFDILNNNPNIKSTYFLGSRRAIIIPSLWQLNTYQDIFTKIIFQSNTTIEMFLNKVGLENYDSKLILTKYHYHLNDYLTKIKNSQFFEELFPIIKENSLQEYKSILKYLKNIEFTGKVGIVDIGWHGSMQKALDTIAQNTDIYGYYLGLNPNQKICSNHTFAFLFDNNKNEDIYQKVHCFINNLEFLFLAQHGSVKNYNDSNVNFFTYEYENKNEKIYSQLIQMSALTFVKNHQQENYDLKTALLPLLKTFLNPRLIDVYFWGNLNFKDSIFKPIVKFDSPIKYILKLQKLFNDYQESSWRIGFLKKILILPLPYYKLNCLIRYINKRSKKNE